MSAVLIQSQPMLARRQLRLAVLAALQRIQGVSVDSPGDWATPPAKLPAILMRVGRERKEALTRSMPEFTTVATVEIEARVEATTAAAAQDAIEALCYSIENMVLTDFSVIGMTQKVSSIDSEIEITANGKSQFGGVKMEIAVEMMEAFDPTVPAPRPTVWPATPSATQPLTSVGIHADMTGSFDPDGTYTPSPDAPAYTPVPAPRTTGPDGRDEGALDITLPQ